jgi:hypothetical protein
MPTLPLDPTVATAASWAPLAWTPAEASNFAFFRDRSNEVAVLTATIKACCGRLGMDPATATAIDVGSSDGEFGRRLDDLFGTYLPIPFQDHHDVARFVADLCARRDDQRLGFDVSILAHVLPYIHDPGQLLVPLARHADRHGVGIAVLLAPSGDQHRVGQLALDYAVSARLHDHADRFVSWLAARDVALETHTVVSEAVAEDHAALLRLLAFVTGTSDQRLLERIAKEMEPTPEGGYRLTTDHCLVLWRLRELLEKVWETERG